MMKQEFVPYKESLELKELGFNEKCLGWYFINNIRIKLHGYSTYVGPNKNDIIEAPLFQQAFRWFRDVHNKNIIIETLMNNQGFRASIMISHPYQVINIDERWDKWEGAELACLRELIKIVKHKLTE